MNKPVLTLGLFAALALIGWWPAAGQAQPPAPLPSWCLGPFVKPAVNPIITPRPESTFLDPMTGKAVAWEHEHTFNPAAAVLGGQVYVLYRAEDDSGHGIGSYTSRLGLATSRDGEHFARRPTPVLYPDNDDQKPYEWHGGCEDPRCVEAGDGTYVLTYTEWGGSVARIGVATSRDLVHWAKHGPAFAQSGGGKFRDVWSKSGSIVSRVQGDHLVAAKINGRYWMYWGEGVLQLATSTDLIHWDPVLDAAGNIRPILTTRAGKFDSSLVEGGPAAILFKNGLVVLYNGRNGASGDPQIGNGAYCGGQALFDPHDPTHLLDRPDRPYIVPTAPYERTGQYAAGTVFTEGLVHFRGRWRLYYGTADTDVAMAEAPFRRSDGVPPPRPKPVVLPPGTVVYRQSAPLTLDGRAAGPSSSNIPGLPIAPSAPWTMNVFVRPDAAPGLRTLIAGFGDGGDSVGASRYFCRIAGGIHFWGGHIDIESAQPFDIGQWQMLTAVCDGKTVTLYKNASPVGSCPADFTDAAPIVQIAPLGFWPDSHRFVGQIHGFTVWNSALKPAALQALLPTMPK